MTVHLAQPHYVDMHVNLLHCTVITKPPKERWCSGIARLEHKAATEPKRRQEHAIGRNIQHEVLWVWPKNSSQFLSDFGKKRETKTRKTLHISGDNEIDLRFTLRTKSFQEEELRETCELWFLIEWKCHFVRAVKLNVSMRPRIPSRIPSLPFWVCFLSM